MCVPSQARGSDLRVHFKNTREAAFALRKKDLQKAKRYLEDVLAHKRCIPFRRFAGKVGRTAQARNEGSTTDQGRWPVKSCEFLLNLLKNAESNAEVRGAGLHSVRSSGAGVAAGRRQQWRSSCLKTLACCRHTAFCIIYGLAPDRVRKTAAASAWQLQHGESNMPLAQPSSFGTSRRAAAARVLLICRFYWLCHRRLYSSG